MGKAVTSGINDLATINPSLASEWDFNKNAPLTPGDVSGGLNQKAFWLCPIGHSYEASINSRNLQNTGCPFCSGQKILPGFNDLSSTHPLIASDWDSERNYPLTPDQVSKGSKRKVFWLCSEGHSFEASVGNRVAGRSCSFCSGKKVLTGFNDLSTVHPEISSEWDYAKNYPVSPQEISKSSNRIAHWLCTEGHSYEATISNRIGGKSCPYCAGKRVLSGFNDLATTHPFIAQDWDHAKNHPLTPESVSKGTYLKSGSIIKVWWLCPKQHSYEKSIGHRVQGQGCPICSGRQVSMGVNDIATTHPSLAAEWDTEKNANHTPTNTSAGSGAKVFWICPQGHSYRSVIGARTNGGTGCPKCANYGYDSTQEGLLYFIKSESLSARKIGITNPHRPYDRLAAYGPEWTTVCTYTHSDGQVIRDLETQIFRWIRKELQLPQYLDREDMGKGGGQSETFTSEVVTDLEVIQKIESILESLSSE